MEKTENFIFNATILDAVNFHYNINNVVQKRIVKDYELDICMSGNRTIKINGDKFVPTTNSIIFRKPRDVVESFGSYSIKGLTLDFSQTRKISGVYNRNLVGEFQSHCDNHLLELIPQCFTVSNPNNIVRIFDLIYIEHLDPKKEAYCSALTDELLFTILAEVYHQKTISYHNYSELGTITKICNFIHENLKSNLSINMLAQHVNLSPNYLIRIFKRAMMTTPQEYITNERLTYSKALLSQTNLKISYIAEQCGFNDTSYFSYVFKKNFGITAKEYREKKNKN